MIWRVPWFSFILFWGLTLQFGKSEVRTKLKKEEVLSEKPIVKVRRENPIVKVRSIK